MAANSAPDGSPPHSSAPGPIDPSETFHFASRDGTKLYGEWFAAERPRAAALIIHGYAEHCGRYREVANVLVGAGLATLSYDMRGHGRAEGQRGHVDGYRDYLRDMAAALEQLEQRSTTDGRTLPVLLVGHSNGGLIALRALSDPARVPENVVAAVLSSPFLGLKAAVPLPKEVVGKLAGRFLPTLSLPSELRIDHLTHDQGKLAERRVDTLCHEVASARWFTSALRTQQYVAELVHHMRIPTLWLIADGDHIADPAATHRVYSRVRAPSRRFRFPEMHHEIFNEVDRGRVFDHLRDFIEERFPST